MYEHNIGVAAQRYSYFSIYLHIISFLLCVSLSCFHTFSDGLSNIPYFFYIQPGRGHDEKDNGANLSCCNCKSCCNLLNAWSNSCCICDCPFCCCIPTLRFCVVQPCRGLFSQKKQVPGVLQLKTVFLEPCMNNL